MAPPPDPGTDGGESLLVDIKSGEIRRMKKVSLASAGLQERRDLQQWILEHPDLIAPGLLLITTEFDQWVVRDQRVSDRLDALFLDPSGSPVVVEFKRDKATDTVELQALKYAAYCSQLAPDELAELLAARLDISPEEAQQQLVEHAPAVEDGVLGVVKILLVAGSFGPAVTSVVLWLRDFDVDIGCVEVSARALPGDERIVLSTRQLLPLPEAKDYLVRRRHKEQAEARARQDAVDWDWDAYAKALPTDHIEVARRLFDDLTQFVKDEHLPWTAVLRGWWLGYKRPGGYYVPLVILHREKPIDFAVKLPDDPERLKLANPYPQLENRWKRTTREWAWAVPGVSDVPDVRLAVEMSMRYQPATGPMASIQKPSD